MEGANSKISYYPTWVVKEITSDEMDEPLEVAAAREVHAMVRAKTGYPYIPRFYSLEGTKIRMERIFGITLGDYIQKFPSREIYLAIAQMARRAARGIVDAGVHQRDLTPNNIIISDDGQFWVIDFGLADLLSPLDDREDAYRATLETFFDVFDDFLMANGLEEIILDIPIE